MSDATSRELYDNYWTNGVAGWHVEAELTAPVRGLILSVVSGKSVLDYGGGDGQRYGSLVQEAASTYTVADVSPAILKRRQGEGATTVHVDDMHTVAGQFDAAICLEVLEHLLDPLAAAKVIAGSLKPGGQVLLSVPNAFNAMNRIRMLVGRLPASGIPKDIRGRTYIAPHVRFFEIASLVGLAREGGLTPVAAYTDRTDFGRFAKSKDKLRQLPLDKAQDLRASSIFLLCDVARPHRREASPGDGRSANCPSSQSNE